MKLRGHRPSDIRHTEVVFLNTKDTFSARMLFPANNMSSPFIQGPAVNKKRHVLSKTAEPSFTETGALLQKKLHSSVQPY